MNNIIAQAQYRIRKFAEGNNIELNEEMLKVRLETAREYGKRWGYTLEDVREDLDGDEAMFIRLDPFSCKPVIVYDKDKLEFYDEEEAIQIIIHEYLHFAIEDEGEDEALSFIITWEYDNSFEEGRKNIRSKYGLQKLLTMYKNSPEVALVMNRKLNTLTIEEVRRWLE